MVAATRLGYWTVWSLIGVAIYLFGGPRRGVALKAMGSGVLVSLLLCHLLKRLVARRRPGEFAPHVFHTPAPQDAYSFPSEHSIAAFACSVPLGLEFSLLAIPLAFLTISICASRVVLGEHFLSDVLAGSVLGAAIGYGAWRLVA
jgi:undecaprenyl-diphosphatase